MNPYHRVVGQLRGKTASALSAFANDNRGVTSVIFGLFIIAVLFVAAVAIDYGRLVTERARDQRALDAAILAASNQLGMDNADVTGETMAKAFYAANRGQNTDSELKDVVLDSEAGEISARTSTDWPATLLRAVEAHFPGISQDRNLSVSAKVRRGNGTTEIALVLDNSGSMSGSYISDLKTAAKDLLEPVFAGVEGTDRVMVGVVPFAAAVNVGSMYAAANWIDSAGNSPIHFENFSEQRTRFQLFNDLGVSWAGCVEARPAGLDVTDAPPTGGGSCSSPCLPQTSRERAGVPRSVTTTAISTTTAALANHTSAFAQVIPVAEIARTGSLSGSPTTRLRPAHASTQTSRR